MLLSWLGQEEFLGLEASLHMLVSFIFGPAELTLLVLGSFPRPLGSAQPQTPLSWVLSDSLFIVDPHFQSL